MVDQAFAAIARRTVVYENVQLCGYAAYSDTKGAVHPLALKLLQITLQTTDGDPIVLFALTDDEGKFTIPNFNATLPDNFSGSSFYVFIDGSSFEIVDEFTLAIDVRESKFQRSSSFISTFTHNQGVCPRILLLRE
jgi:hypothetical protein